MQELPYMGVFRAEERVFDAMVDGWRAQMIARGLTTATIENRSRLVRRFQEFTGKFPHRDSGRGARLPPRHNQAPCRRLGGRIQQIRRGGPGY